MLTTVITEPDIGSTSPFRLSFRTLEKWNEKTFPKQITLKRPFVTRFHGRRVKIGIKYYPISKLRGAPWKQF